MFWTIFHAFPALRHPTRAPCDMPFFAPMPNICWFVRAMRCYARCMPADGDGETVGKAATKGAEGATGAATTGNAAPAELDGDAAAQPAMAVTFETGFGTEGGDASTEAKSKKKKKKKKKNPAATLLTWASKYKSKEVLPTVIEVSPRCPAHAVLAAHRIFHHTTIHAARKEGGT